MLPTDAQRTGRWDPSPTTLPYSAHQEQGSGVGGSPRRWAHPLVPQRLQPVPPSKDKFPKANSGTSLSQLSDLIRQPSAAGNLHSQPGGLMAA